MIWLAGIGFLGVALSLILLNLAPDRSRGINTMLLVSSALVVVSLGWQLYLGSLVPQDLNSVFEVLPDIKGLHSTPDNRDTQTELDILTFASTDPGAAELADQVRGDLEAGTVQVWVIEVHFTPEQVFYHYVTTSVRNWALNGSSPHHLLFRSGTDQAVVFTQPTDKGSLVLYALYIEGADDAEP